MIKITTYLLTLKSVSSMEDGSSYRQYLCYVSIYAFTNTLLSERHGTNVKHESLHSPVFSNVPPSFQIP